MAGLVVLAERAVLGRRPALGRVESDDGWVGARACRGNSGPLFRGAVLEPGLARFAGSDYNAVGARNRLTGTCKDAPP
jgi:hypothetical protein